jgi:hypothetical protein
LQDGRLAFVLFDGGDKSLAKVRLAKDARWGDMRAGVAGSLQGRQIYGLRYIDPADAELRPKMVRNEAEWAGCLACCAREKDLELEVDITDEPPQVKYKLALKASAEKGEKKKIYYQNVYDTAVTFLVSSDSPLVSTKESQFTVPSGEKQAIILRFVPVDTPREETLVLTLAEEAPSTIKHTVRVHASWS